MLHIAHIKAAAAPFAEQPRCSFFMLDSCLRQFVLDSDEFLISATIRKGSERRGNLREATITRTIKLQPADEAVSNVCLHVGVSCCYFA